LHAFFDTNIILYSLLTDDLAKANAAIARLSVGGTISVQVLNEMSAVLRGRKKWSWQDTNSALSATKSILDVVDLTLPSHELATEISDLYGYSIYDANILASANIAKCDVLWSEDMQHGQMVNGVQILNPFRETNEPTGLV
jgi:predicted nucleic acid-binding protein